MQNHVIDPTTGIELSPGNPEACKGNGSFDGCEMCCDECDYFTLCFPDWQSWNKVDTIDMLTGESE